MKKIWMAQPTNMLSKSVYLPYSIGAIAAYAWQFQDIKESFSLQEFLFLKDPVDDVIAKMDVPFLVAFSCYMWNMEYNLNLARAIKEKWNDCVIVFGGPQIPPDVSCLKEYAFIDVLLFGEGEEVFCSLLRALRDDSDLSCINNIAYRKDQTPIMTLFARPLDISDYPSPYTEGYFDSILQNERFAHIQFDAVFETNRGCPFKCIYCSWGDHSTKVRLFPMERVREEILWFAKNRIAYVFFADANFGLFPRDLEIARFLASVKEEYGYPEKLDMCTAKGQDERVFQISKALAAADLTRSISVPCQSLSPKVLKIIGRKDISLEWYSSQLKRFRDAGIATTTDLILGLPGETFDSFCDGLFSVIEAGQHAFLTIFRCELLPNAPMYSPEIIDKYKIKTVKSQFFQNHSPINHMHASGAISNIVVETNTMSRNDWRRMSRVTTFVQAFHCLGLLRYLAIYLRQALDVSYRDFYMHIFDFIEHDSDYLKGMLDYVTGCFDPFLEGKGDLYFADERFGDIFFAFEEGLFLCAAADYERFYAEIQKCTAIFFDDPKLFKDLFRFQTEIMTLPGGKQHTASFNYDWLSYFKDIYDPVPRFPRKQHVTLTFYPDQYDDLADYARHIVWYGKRSKTICSMIHYS